MYIRETGCACQIIGCVHVLHLGAAESFAPYLRLNVCSFEFIVTFYGHEQFSPIFLTDKHFLERSVTFH